MHKKNKCSRFERLHCKLKEKQIHQLNKTGLQLSAGGRLTSWLFTSMTDELNQVLQRNNSSLVVRVELEPETSGFHVGRPVLANQPHSPLLTKKR